MNKIKKLAIQNYFSKNFIKLHNKAIEKYGLDPASYLCYLLDKEEYFQDEFFIQRERIEKFTKLSPKIQRNREEIFIERNILLVVKKGNTNKNYYRINTDILFDDLMNEETSYDATKVVVSLLPKVTTDDTNAVLGTNSLNDEGGGMTPRSNEGMTPRSNDRDRLREENKLREKTHIDKKNSSAVAEVPPNGGTIISSSISSPTKIIRTRKIINSKNNQVAEPKTKKVQKIKRTNNIVERKRKLVIEKIATNYHNFLKSQKSFPRNPEYHFNVSIKAITALFVNDKFPKSEIDVAIEFLRWKIEYTKLRGFELCYRKNLFMLAKQMPTGLGMELLISENDIIKEKQWEYFRSNFSIGDYEVPEDVSQRNGWSFNDIAKFCFDDEDGDCIPRSHKKQFVGKYKYATSL